MVLFYSWLNPLYKKRKFRGISLARGVGKLSFEGIEKISVSTLQSKTLLSYSLAIEVKFIIHQIFSNWL
jgi:hypothetical protein